MRSQKNHLVCLNSLERLNKLNDILTSLYQIKSSSIINELFFFGSSLRDLIKSLIFEEEFNEGRSIDIFIEVSKIDYFIQQVADVLQKKFSLDDIVLKEYSGIDKYGNRINTIRFYYIVGRFNQSQLEIHVGNKVNRINWLLFHPFKIHNINIVILKEKQICCMVRNLENITTVERRVNYISKSMNLSIPNAIDPLLRKSFELVDRDNWHKIIELMPGRLVRMIYDYCKASERLTDLPEEIVELWQNLPASNYIDDLFKKLHTHYIQYLPQDRAPMFSVYLEELSKEWKRK